MRIITFEPWDRRCKSLREKCLFAGGLVAGLVILTGAVISSIPQAIWFAERGVPAWGILLLTSAQLLVGLLMLFSGPAWPRISWWLFKKRQVAAFERDAEQRLALLKVASVTEIAALSTLLNDASRLYEMARGSAFATASSPQPRAFWTLGKGYSERLGALADGEKDPAARLAALKAMHQFQSLHVALMVEDYV